MPTAEAFGFRKILDTTFILPYTREVFAATQDWTQAHKIFPDLPPSTLSYDEAALL